MRQNILGLEKKCVTKDFWFRLLTTARRLTIFDMYWWYRNKKFKVTPIELMQRRNK